MPPFDFWLGRMCFFTIITCSTRTLPVSGNTRSTRPCLPLSRPLNTFTVSLRRISIRLCAVVVAVAKSKFQFQCSQGFEVSKSQITQSLNLETRRLFLQNFRRQTHNLQ